MQIKTIDDVCFEPLRRSLGEEVSKEAFRVVSFDEVPKPYHEALCQTGNLTPALERLHRTTATLQVIDMQVMGTTVRRTVVLVSKDDAPDATTPIEASHSKNVSIHPEIQHQQQQEQEKQQRPKPLSLGAIDIHLEFLSDAARDDVLAARAPLGSILRSHSVPQASQVAAVFQVRCGPVLAKMLGCKEGMLTFGRCNALVFTDGPHKGEVLADVGEVLAPFDESL